MGGMIARLSFGGGMMALDFEAGVGIRDWELALRIGAVE